MPRKSFTGEASGRSLQQQKNAVFFNGLPNEELAVSNIWAFDNIMIMIYY
jgi:hypothetical protein